MSKSKGFVAAALVTVLLTTACAHMDGKEDSVTPLQDGFALADTEWELVQIASGDEITTVEPGLYTMLVRSDGTAAFRLDCNRGFGKWQGADGDAAGAGTIVFSDIGVTKALCPPGFVSDRVTADLSRFAIFRTEGDHLILTTSDATSAYLWHKASGRSD